jgi:hypothetical protein
MMHLATWSVGDWGRSSRPVEYEYSVLGRQVFQGPWPITEVSWKWRSCEHSVGSVGVVHHDPPDPRAKPYISTESVNDLP